LPQIGFEMNHKILLVLTALLLLFACTPDRKLEAPRPIVNEAGEALLYYWDFNGGSTAQLLLRPTLAFGNGNIFFQVSEVDAADGSPLNLREGASIGNAARFRNPSEYVDLVIETTNYGAIKITYAAMRTNNGAKKQRISYSVDGQNFSTFGLQETIFDIGLDWALYEIDLSNVPAANDHPALTLRLTFDDGHTGATGNQRIDNLAVEGRPLSF
jgi:hypothetical protein